MDSSKRKVMVELLGGKRHHWPHFHPADVKSMLGKVRPADGRGYPETTLRGFSQWKTVQISILSCPLPLSTNQLTLLWSWGKQRGGYYIYSQGEKKKRNLKRNILNKIQAFSRTQAGEADLRKLCIGQISRVGLQINDLSRRWQTPS